MKKSCFRMNKKTGEITSFHIPLKHLTPGECACAEEALKGFAREAKSCMTYMDEMQDLWKVVKELEDGSRRKSSWF